jgi:CheY-like chemotaxis protein
METKYKVLIVEDDPLIRQIYTERLSADQDIDVFTAEDGLDGLNKIKEQKYNLIFSGIQMPNKTGFELFQDLQNDVELSNIPFVIFSHLGRVEDIQTAKELGIDNFIIRGSTTPDEVAMTIKHIISKHNMFENLDIKQYKILIVEDNSEIRATYRDRFVQSPQIIVEEAIDGLDGLNKIKTNKYDLVFSGIYMPNQTGFELFQEVQNLVDKKDIPIVLFSHWGRPEDIERAKELGVKYFIIRGQNTPNDIFNQILSILSVNDQMYKLVIKKDSLDYSKFVARFYPNYIIENLDNDDISVRVILSENSKPFKFFIELDDINK